MQVIEIRKKDLGFPGCYTQGCCRGREMHPGQNSLLGEGGMSKKWMS